MVGMALEHVNADLNLDQYIASGLLQLEAMLLHQWQFAVWLEQHHR